MIDQCMVDSSASSGGLVISGWPCIGYGYRSVKVGLAAMSGRLVANQGGALMIILRQMTSFTVVMVTHTVQ